MQIAVITVEREPMYLYDTLEQLVASVPFGARNGEHRINVFVGTPAIDGIAKRVFAYAQPRLILAEIWTLIEPLPPKLRAVGNFIAALRSSDDDLMIFEDDVAIKPTWLAGLENSLAWHGNLDSFVSLYSHIDRRRCHCAAGGLRPRCPACGNVNAVVLRPRVKTFYGTLGLFVPAKHRQGLAEAAMAQLAPTNPFPPEQRMQFDQVVTQYINDHLECSMIVTIPSYVDHRGDVSTINPTHGPRRAPMF